MIFSITDRCNLNCKGCYNKALRQSPKEEMSTEKLEKVISEAKETKQFRACPFAPYSDTNLRNSSLKDALQSEFLKAIRQNRDQLHETEGGCALWVKREWVRSLLHQK